MTELNDSLRTLFSTPFCPNCATLLSAEQYDDVDDRARCSNCGAAYRIPAERRPPHPEDALEYDTPETPEAIALARFCTDAERIADTIFRQTAGASYELYARRYSEALGPYIDALEPALRPRAIEIAESHGYYEETDDSGAGFGPGLCSFSGIEEDYCHCGRHP